MKSDFSMASILMGCGSRPKSGRSDSSDGGSASVSPEREVCPLKGTAPGGGGGVMTQEGLSGIKQTDSEEVRKIRVNLEEEDLWKNFHRLTNEMIVTKNGR